MIQKKKEMINVKFIRTKVSFDGEKGDRTEEELKETGLDSGSQMFFYKKIQEISK